MRTILPISLLFIAILSGCNSNSSDKAQSETSVNTIAKQEVKVIYNDAKSQRVLSENQVKTNVSYTHLGVSGARYQNNN